MWAFFGFLFFFFPVSPFLDGQSLILVPKPIGVHIILPEMLKETF